MCGIIGYVGARNPIPIILSGLRRLEYRGYDSAGIALIPEDGSDVLVVKAKGRIADLERRVNDSFRDSPPRSFLGMGHTRWATHGEPSELNAHPHLSRDGSVAIVHNGIVENFASLRRHLEAKGFPFRSQTDSEVIAHLIEACYEGDLRAAVAAATAQLQGTYGLLVISKHHPGLLVAARRGSPMVVGVGDGEMFVASDVSAIVAHTRRAIYLDDGDILAATASGTEIVSARNVPVARELRQIDWDLGLIEKGGFEHFMLKEIHEQPQSMSNTLRGRLLPEEGTANLSGMQMAPGDLSRIRRVLLAACGTSYYAGMVGKYLIEDLAGVPADVEQAAEFRYRNPIIERDTCLLAISQSGETADTLAAVREALRKGATVMGVCNVVGSTIAREAGRGVYLHAGPEIGVASTKAFTSQVAALAMIALLLGRTRRLPASAGRQLVEDLQRLPAIVEAVLATEPLIREIATRFAKAEHCFFIGRGYMYPAALEGALKLKEISYIHAEGYHAAELKHGPIALLSPDIPVIAAAPDIPGKSKTLSNIQECRARGAPVITIATEGDSEVDAISDAVLRIPPCVETLCAIPVVVAEQLFAYHVARCRGCPIDQPRNLAKSVTVE